MVQIISLLSYAMSRFETVSLQRKVGPVTYDKTDADISKYD